MKWYLYVFILSFSIFASGEKCLTHGDCQMDNSLEQGQRCVPVITGLDPQGNTTCSLRCYSVPLAYVCLKKRTNGKKSFVGRCLLEKNIIPKFSSSRPDCKKAVDPADLDI